MTGPLEQTEKKARWVELTLTMLKIGLFTFGGGWSIVAQMQKEFVEKRGWLTAEELVKLPLMAHFPLLRDVVVDNDMDEDMIQLARDVLSKKRVFP